VPCSDLSSNSLTALPKDMSGLTSLQFMCVASGTRELVLLCVRVTCLRRAQAPAPERVFWSNSRHHWGHSTAVTPVRARARSTHTRAHACSCTHTHTRTHTHAPHTTLTRLCRSTISRAFFTGGIPVSFGVFGTMTQLCVFCAQIVAFECGVVNLRGAAPVQRRAVQLPHKHDAARGTDPKVELCAAPECAISVRW
jgi:hypothetical protein